MRELFFKVNGQKLQKDSNCNFNNIIAGTRNYLVASFLFSSDWSGMSKVAVFKKLDEEYPVKIIKNKCIIPADALTWRNFSVYVIGKKDDSIIKTNSDVILQEVV